MRNRVLALGAILMVTVALGACANVGGAARTGPVTLRLGLADLPPSGVPWSGAGAPGQYLWSDVFDALTVMAPDGTVKGALARSWTARDPRTWDFRLRDGITFSNGERLDAAAVAQTLQFLLSPAGRTQFSANVTNYAFLTGATALDASTVEVTSSQSNALVPNALSIAYIVPPRLFQEQGVQAFASHPVGTGPFTVAQWSADRIVLDKRAKGSWRGVPRVDEVQVTPLRDPAARLQALQSGQLDVANGLDPDQLVGLRQQGFRVIDAPRAGIMSLALITNRGGPLEKPEVRQALNYAVDREAMAKNLYRGLSAPGVWPVQGVHGFASDRRPFPHDPARARQLLAAAGYPNGFGFTAEIVVGQFPADADIYQAMAADLKQVGVTASLVPIDFGSQWLPKFTGRARWAGDAFGLSWNAAPLMDGIRPFNYFSCKYAAQYYCDPQAQPLIDRVNTSFDPGPRDQALRSLLDYNMQNPPAILLVESRELWATRSSVQGVTVAAMNLPLEKVSATG
jgi:peptide/nickel transport system substrate-binding protein